MAHNFFLSHFGGDQDVAEIIANTLSRLSLKQIIPWFSSDSSKSGGLKPGNIWFNEILNKITQSKALVAVLTPNSIGRPWIYFESGIAQSLESCEIIPVCVGLKRDEVPPPLGMYQCYQLTDNKSLKEFVSKLLTKFDITFDEEMSKTVLEKSLSSISKIDFSDKQHNEPNQSLTDALTDLKSHIDKRFIDLLDKQYLLAANNNTTAANEYEIEQSIIYTISMNVNFPEFKGKQFIEVRSEDTVQDVLDNMYFVLKDYIKAYTYMEKWVLRNPKTNQRMILREIGRMVPAKFVFRQDIEWEAIKLQSEYKASSSNEIVRTL